VQQSTREIRNQPQKCKVLAKTKHRTLSSVDNFEDEDDAGSDQAVCNEQGWCWVLNPSGAVREECETFVDGGERHSEKDPSIALVRKVEEPSPLSMIEFCSIVTLLVVRDLLTKSFDVPV
jgi:hypothetical protein